ncbi:hypothetical protein [Desulfonatronum sp. SC1]|uniref:hypothetical protein n=1 Tax=Desulfonatronum sp. SC1 TaxID=2109626 RepID=UPI000D31D800|nr:hypothetical protein [Desulfonatronum sp. SC1]PTN37492.1 hypothetical protein C6366_05900 [Desulfonatronum sp. SC1]
MAVIIVDPAQFSKKTAKMLKSGGKAEGAARQARTIIQDLADSGRLDPIVARKLTTNGEARMENCWKFNLAGGHRLVLAKHEGDFVFLFLGTHDETDTWIKNNTGIKLDVSGGEIIPGTASGPSDSRGAPDESDMSTTLGPSSDDDDYYDRPLHELIDQNMLREIFRGLCDAPGLKVRNESPG